MPNSQLTFRFLAEPTHVNFGGKVHGGSVMKWMDEAAYACASSWCGRYCVTVSVSAIRFVAPIHIGDIVEIHARVLLTGRTSLTVGLEVHATHVRTQQRSTTTRCLMSFVAVDEEGRPTPVPEFTPCSAAEQAWAAYAREARDLHAQLEQRLEVLHDGA